jgi:hypothetical protein
VQSTKVFLTAIALMWLMTFPRSGAAQALQEIRAKPVEPETLVDFSFAKGL